MSMPRHNFEGFRIFVDEPKIGQTVLDFPNYISTLSNIIESSKPRYTIGIFGEWGTGKSTLMDNMIETLQNQYNCMYFNAWRYEGEKRNATYPLMLSILEKLVNTSAIHKGFEEKKPGERETFGQKIFRVLNAINVSGSIGLPGASVDLSIDKEKLKKQSDKLSFAELTDFFKEIKSPLVEGINILRDDLLPMIQPENIPGENKELKLIVFIDDLDRCTPEKAAQILESIKVFFDIDGIVFVLGLSKEIVEAAIDAKYEKFAERGIFSSSDYIKKIIQVPFALPAWTKEDLEEFLEDLIEKHEDETFKGFFRKHKKIISGAVSNNPREIKRLLNNFLLARKIFAEYADNRGEKTEPEPGEEGKEEDLELLKEENLPFNIKLLLIQSLSLQWGWFYDYIFTHPQIASDVKGILKQYDEEGRRIDTRSQKPDEKLPPLEPSKFFIEKGDQEDTTLISFLKKFCEPILSMDANEWETFRRTTEIEEIDFSSEDEIQDQKDRQDIMQIQIELERFEGYLTSHINNYEKLKTKNLGWRDDKKSWQKDLNNLEDSINQTIVSIKTQLDALRKIDEKAFLNAENRIYKITKFSEFATNSFSKETSPHKAQTENFEKSV